MVSLSPSQNNTQIPSPSLLPSPRSLSSNSSTITSSSSNNNNGVHPPKPITRSEPGNLYPTTFVQADTSSFKQFVQMLTGSPKPATANSSDPSPMKTHTIPPSNPSPRSNNPQASSSMNEGIRSVRITSPVMPLIFDLFDRTSPILDLEAEERAIKEKGFYLHPSLASTLRWDDIVLAFLRGM
ncbi:hypothetical protein QN277_026730 [Acacia crassicarpa]|uniref:VQ domain-containing protein n=1 Tax=Acacia crassicarpa TaxID=499986 RepID=A0AAE1J9V9_9FABA|nr:hypothetical protein QN277_026730 [Acacia crassicarpa]